VLSKVYVWVFFIILPNEISGAALSCHITIDRVDALLVMFKIQLEILNQIELLTYWFLVDNLTELRFLVYCM
jgi:hypothetical protein